MLLTNPNPTKLLDHETKEPSHDKIMKYNLLTLRIALATLTTVANISLAQDEETQPAKPATTPRAKASSGGGSSSASTSSTMSYDDRTGTAVVTTKNPTSGSTSTRLLRATRASSTGRSLVIPQESMPAKAITDAEEDLNVMARILDKAANDGGDKAGRAMGITLSSRSGGAPQNLYLGDYGAIFFLNVNYPLLPPPVADSSTNAKENTSNEWEEARREISQPPQPNPFGGGGGGFGGFGGGSGYQNGGTWTAATSQDYDADKVEELKKDVITALKNAAHIRNLKSDEVVTVVVTGPGTTVSLKSKKSAGGEDAKDSDDSDTFEGAVKNFQYLFTGDRPMAGPSAKLIIRAKKSDADAFQKGSLNFDQFRKKVTVILY
jgi:hypothetical protein